MRIPSALLFKVITRDHKTFCVYTDGRIDGFGEDCAIVNYFPNLLSRAIADNQASLANGTASPPEDSIKGTTSERLGAAQAIAP